MTVDIMKNDLNAQAKQVECYEISKFYFLRTSERVFLIVDGLKATVPGALIREEDGKWRVKVNPKVECQSLLEVAAKFAVVIERSQP